MRGLLLGTALLLAISSAPADATRVRAPGPDMRPCVAPKELANLVRQLERGAPVDPLALERRWEVSGLGWDAYASTADGDYGFSSEAYPRCGVAPEEGWYGFTVGDDGLVATATAWCAHQHCRHS